jgi:hypothetical protein
MVTDLLNDYFKLTVEQKDDLLSQIIIDYFKINMENGLSLIEIIEGVDLMIQRGIENEDYEVAQAFEDIKVALNFVMNERILYV